MNSSLFVSPSIIILLIFSVYPHAGAYAQSYNGTDQVWGSPFKEISGTYEDPESRYEIVLPPGWTGIEFIPGFPLVFPGSIEAARSNFEAAMVILPIPTAGFNTTLWSAENLERLDESDQQCNSETYSYTEINGMEGFHLVAECSSGEYSRMLNLYGVTSKDHVILVAYFANSTSGYNSNLDAFEKSVNTLKVNNHVPFRTAMAELFDLSGETHAVKAMDTQTSIDIQSNSRVTNFDFSEDAKRVSFKVEGGENANGLTVVAADNVIEGPYTVTIDGEVAEESIVAEDEKSGRQVIEISHSPGEHEIVVVGTNVVPEFPLSMVGALAAFIGIVAVIGRRQLARTL